MGPWPRHAVLWAGSRLPDASLDAESGEWGRALSGSGAKRRAAVERPEQQRRLPSADPRDPGYRRLRYGRYADDRIL